MLICDCLGVSAPVPPAILSPVPRSDRNPGAKVTLGSIPPSGRPDLSLKLIIHHDKRCAEPPAEPGLHQVSSREMERIPGMQLPAVRTFHVAIALA